MNDAKTPCHECQGLCGVAEEARCRIASGEDPTRKAHIVFMDGQIGYLSSSVPAEQVVPEQYQSLAAWAGTTH